eukprot:SAG31_NODE_9253_length_1308_cov_1.293631_2_plen_94_part_00
MVTTLRRNGYERCATTPANQMIVEEVVNQEVDMALVGATSMQQSDMLISAVEESGHRRVDDELQSSRDDGDEVRLAIMPQNSRRGLAMAMPQP